MSFPTWASIYDHDWLELWLECIQIARLLDQRAAADALRNHWRDRRDFP